MREVLASICLVLALILLVLAMIIKIAKISVLSFGDLENCLDSIFVDNFIWILRQFANFDTFVTVTLFDAVFPAILRPALVLEEAPTWLTARSLDG